MNRPAVLLDRDATLNENPGGWITSVEDFVPIPGAFEAVGRLCRAGWPVALATNQSCVGRGIATMEQVNRVHEECLRVAAENGVTLDGIFVCPHAPGEGCACRKPMPGLLLEAALTGGWTTLRATAPSRLGLAVYFWMRMGFRPLFGKDSSGALVVERPTR